MKENKVKATVGVFAGIINEKGKLLLRRRIETGSITPGKSFKGCWELPGGGVEVSESMPYCHLVNELKREIKEEVGIEIDSIDPMPDMYPVYFGKVSDLALVTPINSDKEPTTGETKWVDLKELNKLAKDYKAADREKGQDGQGIVSGWGKRMHCMALAAFANSERHSYDRALRCFHDKALSEKEEAKQVLSEIKEKW